MSENHTPTPWQPMETVPRDGTHILAILYREAVDDMDGVRRKAFFEIREIWYRSYVAFGMNLPWHAGDPFDAHDGMAPDHMGEAVPIFWMPMLDLPNRQTLSRAALSQARA